MFNSKSASLNRIDLIKSQLKASSIPSTASLIKLTPSNTQSRFSGGTSDILPLERKKASFEAWKISTRPLVLRGRQKMYFNIIIIIRYNGSDYENIQVILEFKILIKQENIVT